MPHATPPLFQIYQLDAEEALRIQQSENPPHKHLYEELIIGEYGTLEHFIDFDTVQCSAPLASFVTKGKLHRVVPGLQEGRCRMWVIRFQSDLIPETTFQLYAWYHHHATLSLQHSDCFPRMLQLCQMMADEMARPEPELSIIRHLLSALFSMVESERKKLQPEAAAIANKSVNQSFRNFLNLLELHYHKAEGVDFYAEKLFMSPRNLNLICQQVLNMSVSEMIETRKLTEAKNQLIHSSKTIAEIGFDLGYKEKAYFSAVFKKKTGQTPGEFREEMQQRLS